MTNLDSIIDIQRGLIATVKKLSERFLSKDESEKTLGYIESHVLELDNMHQQFKSYHDEIMQIIRDTGIDAVDVPYISEDCFLEFLDIYFTFRGHLLDIISKNEITRLPLSSTLVTTNNRSEANVDTRLPRISLPKFSGQYLDWIPFRDIYISLVHSSTSLSNIQKFYYLKGSLIGEAASLLKSISVTEANYDSAWKMLESRYHNKRKIVDNLALKLYNIPKSDGSLQSIKNLLDMTQECLNSFENLGIQTSEWDPLLIPILCQKLDNQTRREWEQSLKSSTEVASRSDWFNFLENTFRTLESLSDTNLYTPKTMQKNIKYKKQTHVHNSTINKSKTISCLFCERNHYLSQCYKFLALTIKAKEEFLNNRKICRNCFTNGHGHDSCKSLHRCTICKAPHHTVLHIEEPVTIQNSNITSDACITIPNAHGFHNILLYTIRVLVNTNHGQFPLRALLDPGAQGSLISESVVQLLRLPKFKTQTKVSGVGNNGQISKSTVRIQLLSRDLKNTLSCKALVLPNVSSYRPNYSSTKLSLPKFENGSLADPYYYKNDPIDIILGSDTCFAVKIPRESFLHNNLFFQNTIFGWVFSGSSETSKINTINFHNVNLENLLRSFWEQEEVTGTHNLSEEEIACENLFKSTTKRSVSGRYIVNLPFKSLLFNNTLPKLHNNMIGALKRFKQLETSFSNRPLFSETYKTFMQEYENLGHMTKIGTYPADVQQKSYFLSNFGTSEEQSKKLKLNISVNSFSNNVMSRDLIRQETADKISKYPYFFYKFSKLNMLLRAISYCLRFHHNTKVNKNLRIVGNLPPAILNQTFNQLIKISQDIDFSEEKKSLMCNKELKQSSLKKLLPFVDKDGIIRVGGRLQNSNLSFKIKHPILLSGKNPLAKLIIQDSHEKTLHGGMTLTMSYVNRKFWIISGNQLAKTVIHKCMRCFTYSAKAAEQIMGNLPSVRLSPARPFTHSGVDYAGPIQIKNSTLRSAVASKGYICLFICMVTKAIHLEAVSDLSTQSFLAAFRRFISRRGACTDIYSDCGTNFVGASKELQIMFNKNNKSLPEEIVNSLLYLGTDWHFIPPGSPNFGGLWEAGVKSVKYHLKRVMHDRILSFEEITTLLCQIESVLNSRPLCPLTSDPSDLDALTPAHFLIGEPTNCLQEESLLDSNINRLSRWKIIEKLKQHFWTRWYQEYLNRLQARSKWLKQYPDAKVGDLVLVADDRCGPGQWILGRIQVIHPGPDGRVRVVSILTKNKIIKRSISKICFLPTDSTEELSTTNMASMSERKS